MKTFSYTITDEVGIHARPAGLLAKKAKEFESVCTIEKGGKSVNITKLMALMGLGVKQGDTVTVTCEGADEDKASEALKAFFTHFTYCTEIGSFNPSFPIAHSRSSGLIFSVRSP